MLLGSEIGYAHLADLALITERGQRLSQLRGMGEQVGTMNLVQVDDIDVEAGERRLAGRSNGRGARVVGRGRSDPSLGGQHHAVAQFGGCGQDPAKVGLGLPESGSAPVEPVHIGGVHQVDAEPQSRLQ